MLLYFYVHIDYFLRAQTLDTIRVGFVPIQASLYVVSQTFGRFFAPMCEKVMYLSQNVERNEVFVNFSNVEKGLANVETEPKIKKQ